MDVTAPHSPRECRPDDPGPNLQLTPQTSPHLPTDSVGPLDPGQKGMLKQTDQVSTIRGSNPGRAATLMYIDYRFIKINLGLNQIIEFPECGWYLPSQLKF
jgi:hypothetical protein